MEIGLANEENGITYFDLVYQLHGTPDKVFAMEAEQTFFIWFLKNFSAMNMLYSRGASQNISYFFREFLRGNSKGSTYHKKNVDPHLYGHLNQKWFLNGEASKQYLDFQELQQSVKSANSARNWAIISIIVALFAIGISAYSVISSPNLPYDVNIIEDKTRTDELQKENNQLKEELFKAEMMVKVLEETNKQL